jgi:hypothetical protein
MTITSLQKSNVVFFIAFIWKLFACWIAYFTILAIYRLRPLRRLIARIEIVQGRAQFKSRPQTPDFIPAQG